MKCRTSRRGFTVAEILVSSAIASIVIGAAALGYHTMLMAQHQYSNVATVYIGSQATSAFYGMVNSNTVTTYVAPNFGCVAKAESLRENFITDCSQSIAVYCLYRGSSTYNTLHPASLPSPTYGTAMDTPEAFRQYLVANLTGASVIFNTSYRNTGATQNYSIFILGYSANATTIPVLAVYDIDMIPAYDAVTTSTVTGTYSSVKRYVGGAISGYYDMLFATGDATDQFYPGVVAFERSTRLSVTEGSAIDRFKVAQEKPFYFIWWPDPARSNIKLPQPNTASSLNAGFTATDPRQAYNHMAGRTSYMFTVPLFPSS